jgi:hypothetical protein
LDWIIPWQQDTNEPHLCLGLDAYTAYVRLEANAAIHAIFSSKNLQTESIMKSQLRNLVVAAIFGLPALAQATDVTGTVGQIEVNATGSSGSFRVYTAAVNNMCGGTVTEAIIDTTDSNYNVVVSIILTAKALGSTVVFSSTQQADGNCHLYYVVMK